MIKAADMYLRKKARSEYSLSKRASQENLDKNDCFVLRHCINYLNRLLDTYQNQDSETFKFILWILGPEWTALEKHLLTQLKKEKNKTNLRFYEEGCDQEDLSKLISQSMRKASKRLRIDFINFVWEMLDKRFKALSYSGTCETEAKLAALSKMFNLTEQEKDFCTFLYIVSTWSECDAYFVDCLRCHNVAGRRYLRAILGMTDGDVKDVLSGTLSRIEFYEMDRHSLNLTADFLSFFQKPSDQLLTKHYFVRVSRKTISLASHLIDPKETDHIIRLLSEKRESPNHILLYGPPGTGKTSYALGLAHKLKISTYEILREEENTTNKRRTAILACLNMTNGGNDGSLIVVDEADNLLNTHDSWFSRGETQDKGWLNQLLEEPGSRMIWITNSISEIDGSVLRRFAYSAHFRPFNQLQRITLWESILRRHRVKRYFDSSRIKDLSNRYPVSAAVIDMAVKKAVETSSVDSLSLDSTVKMNLNAYMTLIHNGEKPRNKEKIEDNYSLEGLNVEGDLPVILAQLKIFDSWLRTSVHEDVRNMNLLFYGPPGTGKSEMARYIAKDLKRELVCKRASDVISPYVGETEQNISRMFNEAESSEAILIMDEADTFLFNRNSAVRSWEISQTNEFLTQMERFRGVLICTTNRLEGLDNASIRRFNYKIGFNYLKPEGNIVFYRKLLSSLTSQPRDKSIEKDLTTLTNLSPGDFRIVRDRFSLQSQGQVSHRMMMDVLLLESRIKKNHECRKIVGF